MQYALLSFLYTNQLYILLSPYCNILISFSNVTSLCIVILIITTTSPIGLTIVITTTSPSSLKVIHTGIIL